MSRMEVSPRPAPLSNDPAYGSHRHIPILPSASAPTNYQRPDAMEITPPTSAKMPPPKTTSPEGDQDASPKSTDTSSQKENGKEDGQESNGSQNNSTSAGVTAQSSGPKVVQTAFIHKLYSMLEDTSITKLITWSPSGESFVMAPSPDFSKVLATYFKHTNISSFVRQLNMYGFHKVSDVFHTGSAQDGQTMWEFRHGNGSFKKGDTGALREIKRRASRHALIQRDTFQPAPHKPSISQPGTPAEPIGDADTRLAGLEYNMHDMHQRLSRAEEGRHQLSTHCAWLSESLAQHQRWNSELAQIVMRMAQGRDEASYRDGKWSKSAGKYLKLMFCSHELASRHKQCCP